MKTPIVFYDGECGLCDRFVQWLLKRDRNGRLRFATLQGETAKEVVGALQGPSDDWTVKLADDRGVHALSTASLRAIGHLGGVWRVVLALLAVPRPIRDAVYRWIAKHRYRWFGCRRAVCLLPSPGVQERFLP